MLYPCFVEMAGTRGRKILEMVHKINTDRQNNETIADLNQVPPQGILYS